MTETFHTVSDCAILDAHGRVVGVMLDHQKAHEVVDMAERDETWCDPDEVVPNETYAEMVEERDDFAERLARTRVELEEAEDKDLEFREWATARLKEFEPLLVARGVRVKLE